ncbi:hypothetical protein [Novosphingobium mangrovi (ex Huang et al. 2023)]|uniref:Pilus assembly protein n=1 Tax=Novosphingobium mangrovi (ex Huang et al. 2023) TaxID=2976432 RepID=A0ABT2I5I3_9SPHN|nr:hypothetical protein [Novosphingobium mangrovi (ex Huang et al. 2023)]MCT2400060.1 hypothetical protein [Novosphingobium mangrovi (ex Huang et al. 2023)]
MNTDRLRAVLVVLSALSLSACEHSVFEEPGDAAFGEANRQTMMAQVIDPDPQYDEPAASSGVQAARAIEKYTTGSVEKPERVTTSNVQTGTGSN